MFQRGSPGGRLAETEGQRGCGRMLHVPAVLASALCRQPVGRGHWKLHARYGMVQANDSLLIVSKDLDLGICF